MDFLESAWNQPDNGIWEVRRTQTLFHPLQGDGLGGGRSCGAGMVERFDADGPVDRWRALRATIHDDVCAKGFDSERNAFVQYYGGKQLDAALLMVPLVGFCRPRIRASVAPSRPSSANCFRTDWSGAIPRSKGSTVCTARKAPFCRVPFGSPTILRCRSAMTRRAPSSNACLRFVTTWACSRKSTIRPPSASWGTFRRRYPMSA